jgi:hypothetical protein
LLDEREIKNNEQPSTYGFSISSNQEDLHQQDALEQDFPFACRNKQ